MPLTPTLPSPLTLRLALALGLLALPAAGRADDPAPARPGPNDERHENQLDAILGGKSAGPVLREAPVAPAPPVGPAEDGPVPQEIPFEAIPEVASPEKPRNHAQEVDDILGGGAPRRESARPTPAPEAERPPPPPLNRREEALRWEMDLAEASYRVNRTPHNLNRLLTAYEGLIRTRCMGSLPATLRLGPVEDSLCKTYIDRTLELLPSDPFAICAEDGIDARSCLDADARVVTKPRSGSSSPSKELEEKLRAEKIKDVVRRSEDELFEIGRALGGASQSLTAEERRRHKERQTEIYDEIMRLACTDEEYLLLPEKEAQAFRVVPPPKEESEFDFLFSRPTPTPRSVGPSRIEEDYRALRKQAPTPTPEIPTFVRVREVDPVCLRYARLALEADPERPSAVCGQYGAYSPRCIAASRKGKASGKRLPSGTGAGGRSKGGRKPQLESF